MFWKKKQVAAAKAAASPTPGVATSTASAIITKVEAPKRKVKRLTPKDILSNQIEQLTAGQTLRFKVSESWGGDFIYIELNPTYPRKGKRFMLGTENIIGDKPGGKKVLIGDSDKAMELAKWVLDRQGELYISIEKAPVITEKTFDTEKAYTVKNPLPSAV